MNITERNGIQYIEQNGQEWEMRGKTRYEMLGDVPCKIVELRGDIETWKSPTTRIVHAVTLSDGWKRYWLTDDIPGLWQLAQFGS